MPRSELGPHQALLEVPAGLDARREVFCCRYTGEVFLEYEEYVERQNLYRQRAWSSKYSGEGGMTYEEAVASEHKVASVVEQFPAVYEERALRLVHHSTEPLEQLATRVLAHFTNNFVVGEELTGVLPDGRLAPCVVRSVHSTSAPAPQPLPNGILAGCEPNGPTEGPDGPSVGGAAAGAAEGNAGFGGGEQPLQQQQGQQGQPQASSHEEASYEVEWTGVESSPAAGQHSTVQRGALNRRHPSPITALTPALLSKWLETVAWAEPVTGVPGVDCVWHVCDFYRDKYSLPEQLPADMAERLRPSRQKALLKVPSLKDGAAGRRGGEVEFVESTFSEDDEQGAGGLGPGAGGGKPFVDRGEKGDHDFQVEEELQVAREEYASDEEFESDDDYRPIHPGLEGRMKPPPARTPRGRGRGRWGRGRGRWGAGPRLAHSPPPPPASQQPPPPPSLQASDVQAMVEGLEEVERRLQPGSIKHSVFMILKEAGEAGVTISDLVTAAEEKGLKTWDDPRQAKNSVASTCAHDPAFVRVGPAKFALRALVSSQQLLAEDSVPLDQLDEGAQKQLAAVGQQQKEAMRKLAEEKHKPKVEKNNFKCPKCHRTTHHEQSPLLLCDTCPRSYHMACLGLDWRDLPSDDWCCPKCVESTQAALRRVMDLETRKREALERATSRQSEAEDKLLRRLLQKEERERRKAEGLPLGTAGSRALRPAQRGPPDDWETLQDEKENLGRLEIRARELAELAARNPLPEGGIDFADDETASVHQRAAETREALHRLQQILSGPPTFEPLVGSAACAASLAAAADGGGSTGAGLKVEAAGGDGDRGDSSEVQQAVLNEALSLAEFLRIFGEACVAPILTVQDLYRAAAWPLDSPSLPALYSAMLQCCLLEQLNHDPPAKNRARRWSRMLTLSDSVWPELLRRYLAVTRSKTAKDTSYDLTVDPVLMSDDQVALFAAEHLSEAPWWTLPASAHLRLLNVLCYDVAQGYRLRQEINARQQDIVKIQTERFREQTQGRRGGSVVVGGKRGADNGELAPTAGSSKKRKGKKAAAAIALPEPTEEELEEMEAELEAAALEEGEGELDEAARTRRQREAEYDARMQLRASRTEPLGLDRYHRRYWWLRSDPGFVFVEGADGGGGMAAIRTKEELDEVISKLNRRGPREGGLHRGLRRRYNAITTAMANQLSQDAVAGCYVLAQVPRPAAPPPAAAGAPAGVAQHSVEELAQAQDAEVLSEAREKLELFITETQDIGVQMSCELKEVRRQLRAAQTPQQLCEFLLVLESFLGTAGEGLPPGADNVSIALLLGDVPALPEAPSSTALEMQDTAQGGQPGPTAGPAPAAGPAGQTPIKQEPQDGGAAPGREIGAVAGGPAAVEAGAAGSEQRGAAGQDQEQQEGAVKMEVDEGLGAHGSAADLTAAAAGGASVSLAAAAAELKQEDVAAGAAVDVAMVDAPQVDQQPAGEAAAPQASAPHAATAAAAGPALLGKPPLPPSAFAAAGDASGAVPAADDDGAQQVQQALAQHAQQRPLIKSDSLAESLGGTTTATGDEQTQGTGADAGQEQFRPVQPDDDLEDSDAEHAYLREKRMRRPARLWRSARERAVWIKLTREAGNIATKACYAALLLRDRAGPMLQRFISIADEQARWEAEERERQRLEKAESRKRLSETGEEGPPERPLMIRTGKAKTEEGVKIVLKAMGNQPFAMGRHASSIDIIAAPEQVAACRWGYQCSVCLLAGDLLCCEHPDGCNVSCHTECTGLAGLPKGPYICMNHDSRELKTRIRRRASSSLPAKEEAPGGEGAGDDDEATVSEDTQTVDSEATEDEAPRSRSARKRPRRG